MADVIYNGFKQFVADGTIDLQHDEIKCCLLTDAYTPDPDADDNYGDLTGECSGTNYDAGGQALSGQAVTHDDAADLGVFDAEDVTWPVLTVTDARWAVLYKNAVLEADRKLILAKDFGSSQNPIGVAFVVQWHADGILTFS
jgi:hypothetical protein